MADLGCPTKFKPEYAQQLLDFFSEENSTIGEDGKIIPGRFPTLARFACNIGVHRDTMHEWSKKKDEKGALVYKAFSDAYKMTKLYQEAYLYEHGLSGAIHPTFSIWTSKTMLGHREPEAGLNVNHAGAIGTITMSKEEYKEARKEMLEFDDC